MSKLFLKIFLPRFNVWALCPAGYYMQGMRLGAGPPAYLLHIDEAKCCHPQGHPNSYEHCYDQDVTHSFDNKGWSECQQHGYYMTGFYKSSCNDIYCIEKFRCCKMKKGKSDQHLDREGDLGKTLECSKYRNILSYSAWHSYSHNNDDTQLKIAL